MEPLSDMKLSTISALFTEDILRKAVQQIYLKKTGLTDLPDIVNYTVNFASSKGDGYLGVIYRVSVKLQGEDENITLIGKGLPGNLSRRKSFHCVDFFTREIMFYNIIVPAFRNYEKLHRKGSAKEEFLSVPECYYAMNDGENDFIVMEDLSQSGYEMNERSKALTPGQIGAMFKFLARFHAFSFAMQDGDNNFTKITKDIFEPIFRPDQKQWIEQYFLDLSQIYIKSVQDELNHTNCIDKFQKFVNPKTFFDTMQSYVERDDCRVISHGDAWIANFMFRNDCEVKAIDFQSLRYCSPMLDLSTLIFACTTAQERTKVGDVDGIIQMYLSELENTVSALGGQRTSLTLMRMRDLWRQVGAHGLGCSIELVTLSLVEGEDVADVDEIPEGVEVRLEDLVAGLEIKKPESQKRMAEVIQLAVDEGLI